MSSIQKRGWLSVLLCIAIVLVDQLVKFEIKTNFSLYESYHITDWFQLVFTENRGMAFGMQFVGTMFLAVFRVVAIAYFAVVLARLVRRKAPYGIVVCVALIIAGAAGNIFDNFFYGLIFSESHPASLPATLVPFGEGYGSFLTGRVVDMFYFPFFTWPDWIPVIGGDVFFGAIFNVADASISCGAVALALFYYKYLAEARVFHLGK